MRSRVRQIAEIFFHGDRADRILRAFDLGNVAPAIQKFTDDALQELGVIENDNIKFIKAINYRFGWVMKDNPHCELRIEEWREG